MSGTYWPAKQLRGIKYDLTHLHPYLLKVTPKAKGAPTFNVGISFSSHTFTRERLDNDDDDLRYGPPAEGRSFCTKRYECSVQLREIISWAANGKVFFSHEGNYLILKKLEIIAGQYAVAFNVVRAKHHFINVRMFVVSAHERTIQLPKLDTISFATLIAKTARGEVVVRPK